MLNNAKKPFNSIFNLKKISTLFIQNFIHLKSSQNIHSKIYSFKVSPIQKIIHSNLAQNIHSKFYSFKIQPKYSFKNLFIQSLAHSKNYSFNIQGCPQNKNVFIGENFCQIFEILVKKCNFWGDLGGFWDQPWTIYIENSIEC